MPRTSSSSSQSTNSCSTFNPKIEEVLGGFTSDHGWRGLSVQFRNAQGACQLELRGATWNMMDQAQQATDEPGKKKIAHTNNPCGATETMAEYKARRLAQINELEAILDSQKKKLDFVFLQEADWAQAGPTTLDIDVKSAREEIKMNFERMLKRHGFALEISQYNRNDPNKATQQALTTVYNTKTLSLNGSLGAFPLRTVDQVTGIEKVRYRAYESRFTHQATNATVSLTNLHLDFDHDYIAEIDDYMFERTKNNVFTIMGGDTNHPQNEGIHQLIIDWHRPSNITNNSNDELVDFDRRDKNKLKSYDGFCVAPTQTTYAHITEEKGKYFLMDANGKTCKALDYEPATLPNYHHQHFSILGRPWKRTVHILKDLDKQLGEEVVPLQRKKIFDEIQKIASTRLSINDFNSDPRTEKLLHAKQYKVFSELLHTNGYQGSLPRIMNSTILNGSPKCTIDLNKHSFLVALEFSSKVEATNFRNHFGWTKELQGPNQQIISLMPNDVAKLNLNSLDMLNMLLGPLLPAPIQNPAVQSTSSTSYKR